MDQSGHGTYWGSPLYYKMVREKDKQIARILDALAATKTSSGNSNCQMFDYSFLKTNRRENSGGPCRCLLSSSSL